MGLAARHKARGKYERRVYAKDTFCIPNNGGCGQRVREAREACGMSQQEAGHAIDREGWFPRWEAGDGFAGAEPYEQAMTAVLLGRSVEWLLYGDYEILRMRQQFLTRLPQQHDAKTRKRKSA